VEAQYILNKELLLTPPKISPAPSRINYADHFNPSDSGK